MNAMYRLLPVFSKARLIKIKYDVVNFGLKMFIYSLTEKNESLESEYRLSIYRTLLCYGIEKIHIPFYAEEGYIACHHFLRILIYVVAT